MEVVSTGQTSSTVSSDPGHPALLSEVQSSAPQLPEEETMKIIQNLFSPAQISKMRHFHKCRNTGYNGISNEELFRVKMMKKKDRFQHEWLFKRETCLCSQSGI